MINWKMKLKINIWYILIRFSFMTQCTWKLFCLNFCLLYTGCFSYQEKLNIFLKYIEFKEIHIHFYYKTVSQLSDFSNKIIKESIVSKIIFHIKICIISWYKYKNYYSQWNTVKNCRNELTIKIIIIFQK